MITVIGTGTGTGAGTAAGLAAPGVPADATLVVGARRHLDAAALPPGVQRIVLGPLAPALDAIEEHLAKGGTAAVLASGDPGFFGIVRALAERFGAAALDVRPSAPSVAVAFARLGLTWDDAVVVSAHGRDPRTAVNVCRAHPKTAVLTGPGAGPGELGAALAGIGVERTLVVAAALGTAEESVERVSPAEAAARDWSGVGVSVVLCLDEARVLSPVLRTVAGPPPSPAGWALPEEAFAHRDSMVTKYEVRALALARLGPRTGELVWDIGAGSGSVAVECARFGAAVVAVERAADGVDRILANAAAHGVDVQAVHGSAPGVLGQLPDPDAVFIGGGGADLPAIVAACAARVRRVVVVTLAALDRVADVRAALSGAGLVVEGVLLQSSRLAPLPGEVSRLAATNPVFVLWATRGGGPGGPAGAGAPDPAERLGVGRPTEASGARWGHLPAEGWGWGHLPKGALGEAGPTGPRPATGPHPDGGLPRVRRRPEARGRVVPARSALRNVLPQPEAARRAQVGAHGSLSGRGRHRAASSTCRAAAGRWGSCSGRGSTRRAAAADCEQPPVRGRKPTDRRTGGRVGEARRRRNDTVHGDEPRRRRHQPHRTTTEGATQ